MIRATSLSGVENVADLTREEYEALQSSEDPLVAPMAQIDPSGEVRYQRLVLVQDRREHATIPLDNDRRHTRYVPGQAQADWNSYVHRRPQESDEVVLALPKNVALHPGEAYTFQTPMGDWTLRVREEE